MVKSEQGTSAQTIYTIVGGSGYFEKILQSFWDSWKAREAFEKS